MRPLGHLSSLTGFAVMILGMPGFLNVDTTYPQPGWEEANGTKRTLDKTGLLDEKDNPKQ